MCACSRHCSACRAKEIAKRAGVSTPVPRDDDGIETRLARVEAELAEIKALLTSETAT